jgi:hypothetical protein
MTEDTREVKAAVILPTLLMYFIITGPTLLVYGGYTWLQAPCPMAWLNNICVTQSAGLNYTNKLQVGK